MLLSCDKDPYVLLPCLMILTSTFFVLTLTILPAPLISAFILPMT